jgi:hypothetical protein
MSGKFSAGAAIFFLSLITGVMQAQTVNATVCEIIKDPQSFNGKMVQVQGTVRAGLDQFILVGNDCGRGSSGIWLTYPEGTKGKAGAAVVLELQAASNFSGSVETPTRTAVTLDKNKDFKQFDTLLSTPYKNAGPCMGCVKYEVNATIVGRLDGTIASIQRDGTGKITQVSGFGHLNLYSARLVIQSVSSVAPVEIDYAKSTKNLSLSAYDDSSSGDAISVMKQASKNYGENSSVGAQIATAAEAYGKPREENGVLIGFTTNEYSPQSDGKSTSSSPDGVIYNCHFDASRLKGAFQAIALAYAGSLINDLRSKDVKVATETITILQSKALNVGLLTAIAMGMKTFVLPGGTVYWNSSWSQKDSVPMMQKAVTNYLADQEVLTR